MYLKSDAAPLQELFRATAKCKRLEKLEFWYMHISDSSVGDIVDMLPHLQDLKTFRLMGKKS
jgi:hypothetical protein